MCILFPRLLQWEKNTNSGKDFTKVVKSYFRRAVVCNFRENLGFAITVDFINNHWYIFRDANQSTII